MSSATLIEKCCLIANPAAGNPTQYLVEQVFAQAGLDWRFMTFEVEPEKLGDAMRGIRALGFRGVKVAEPFQETVIEHVDELTDAARHSKLVNCVTAVDNRLVGDNTIDAALMELVREHVHLAGRRAMIVGTGRLARTAAIAAAGAGVSAITIAGRNEPAGQQLVELIAKQTSATATFLPLGGAAISVDADLALLVNATSLAAIDPDAKLPLQVDSLGPKLVVVDVAYNTARTWLTHQAADRGAKIVDGLSLYVQQTALALKNWTGLMPDTATMREAAEEFLGI